MSTPENTRGAKHTTSIISGILKQPTELRALQLTGEGFYNYFNLDALQKWLQASAWGTANLRRSLPEDWSALAKVVQQPTCELIRDDQRTYLRLVLPGVRTREMDSRRLQLQAYQQTRGLLLERPYNPQLPPLYWQECSAAWAAESSVVSQDNEVLTLHLPISNSMQTSSFALALNIGYQLEAERDLIHRTCFVLRDLRIATERGVRLPAKGRFTLDPVESMPSGTGKAPFWLFTRDEMATVDV